MNVFYFLKKSDALFLIAALALLLLIPSSDSLWIDEAFNAKFASMGSFHDFLNLFLGNNRSENQMPLSMFLSWVGGHWFGTSELALRGINWVFGLITILSFWAVGKRLTIPWLPLFAAVQPFFWFYMNEARPYALQIASGALLLFALVELVNQQGRGFLWIAAFCLGALSMCGSSLLGVIPFAVIGLAFFFFAYRLKWRPNIIAALCLGLCFALLLALGLFYAWTLIRGGHGAKLWAVGAQNVAFSLYDFAGFNGLGPGRLTMREAALAGPSYLAHLLLLFSVPLLALLPFYSIVFLEIGRQVRMKSEIMIASTGIVVLSFLLLTLAAILEHFPFWGRHIAPAFPFFTLCTALAINTWRTSSPRWKNGLIFAFSSVLLFSCLQLRFASRHAKDDYRTAADFAKKALAQHQTVWWLASEITAEYYGLPMSYTSPIPGTVFSPSQGPEGDKPLASCEELKRLPLPNLIIISKPDIYDKTQGAVQSLIHDGGYKNSAHAQAFTFWTR